MRLSWIRSRLTLGTVLGMVLHVLDRHEEAEQAYQRSKELDPQLPYPWSNLARLWEGKPGRQMKAARSALRAFEIDSSRSWDLERFVRLADQLADGGKELPRTPEAGGHSQPRWRRTTGTFDSFWRGSSRSIEDGGMLAKSWKILHPQNPQSSQRSFSKPRSRPNTSTTPSPFSNGPAHRIGGGPFTRRSARRRRELRTGSAPWRRKSAAWRWRFCARSLPACLRKNRLRPLQRGEKVPRWSRLVLSVETCCGQGRRGRPRLRHRGGGFPNDDPVGKPRGVNDFRRALASPGTFPQAQAVHDAAYVIGVVSHAEACKNRLRETGGGPAIGIHARGSRSGLVDFRYPPELFRTETAGTARRPALPQSLHAAPIQCAIPSGCRRTAYPEFPCNLGLRQPPLQVLCG